VPLARHVTPLDQLGDDPVRGSLGYAYGRGDLSQPGAGIVRDAEKDMGVVRKKVPADRPRRLRHLILITSHRFHEMMIH
jgi:hypothetical protein